MVDQRSTFGGESAMSRQIVEAGAGKGSGVDILNDARATGNQQTDPSTRLMESAYAYTPVRAQQPIPYPSQPPIEGRARYGEVAPIALEKLTPGSANTSESNRSISEYLDYMDYAIATNRKINEQILRELSQAVLEKNQNISDSGFKSLVSAALNPASQDASALINTYQQFLVAHRNDVDPVVRFHTGAALQTALATYLMERGTVIQPTKSDVDGRILGGRNLDLGGHAAGYLFAADKHLYDLQNHLKQNNLGGSEDVQKSRDFIQQKLRSIFGPHDITQSIEALKQAFRQNISEMAHFQIDLVKHVRAMPVRNPAEIKVAAKGCRDVALLNMAIAEYKAERGDGEGANIIYKESVQFLRVATQLDAGNADVAGLQQSSDKLGPVVAEAVKKQYSNWFNNPFGIQR
jgi:hypothetical protein